MRSKYQPRGRTDKAGRWYPLESEKQECCDDIRSPSRSFPWSYYKHCYTLKHIKNRLKSLGITSFEDLPLLVNDKSLLGEIARDILQKETLNKLEKKDELKQAHQKVREMETL